MNSITHRHGPKTWNVTRGWTTIGWIFKDYPADNKGYHATCTNEKTLGTFKTFGEAHRAIDKAKT
jgi:hypothetical protein